MVRVPSRRSKQVFRKVVDAIGAEPKLFTHRDETERFEVAIVRAPDRPAEGFTTFFTVTLNEYPNAVQGQQIPVEIYGVVDGDGGDFGNALSTCAFNMIKDGWLIAPGVVHPDVVAMYPGLSPNLPHMLFTYPMDFDTLSAIETTEGDVYSLQAMPIAESEYVYLLENGFDEMQERLTVAEVDYTDLQREAAF